MNPNSAAKAYLQSSIENAPPVKIVRMLYEGALRAIDRAASFHPVRERVAFNHWVGKANEIVAELRIALEPGPAPEIADGLERVYEFVQFELSQALVRRDIQPLAHAHRSLSTLLEGWRHVELQTSDSH
ncbi:MAG: flagellar export chaperone FliS [Planctomycetes bacterium]|nr:flagellar export chaperone FliS [Planctomycetota bacterium]